MQEILRIVRFNIQELDITWRVEISFKCRPRFRARLERGGEENRVPVAGKNK